METREVERGHLALPGSPGPGVVMIPDVWGLSDHYRDLAGRLAAEGFAVLAIDLYSREKPAISSPAEAMQWIRGLSDPQVLGDLQAGIDLLAGPEVGAARVGITGFCMGGQYALLAACACRGLSACVPFYGMLAYEDGLDPAKKPRSPLAALVDLTCPVLGLYGEDDHLIPVPQVRELEAGLERSPHPGEVVLYPGAGHAFMNETRPEMYRADAARDAWPRMLEFFREKLQR